MTETDGLQRGKYLVSGPSQKIFAYFHFSGSILRHLLRDFSECPQQDDPVTHSGKQRINAHFFALSSLSFPTPSLLFSTITFQIQTKIGLSPPQCFFFMLHVWDFASLFYFVIHHSYHAKLKHTYNLPLKQMFSEIIFTFAVSNICLYFLSHFTLWYFT